tara:strand:- start:4752 stop:4868 length:117 start_codon:yes stop_codon:yes gene_type:complete
MVKSPFYVTSKGIWGKEECLLKELNIIPEELKGADYDI